MILKPAFTILQEHSDLAYQRPSIYVSVEIGKIQHEGGARSNLGVMGILMGITAVEDEVFRMTDLIKLNVGHRP